MKIYVTRHGQTDWNVQGKTQGRADIELNEVGIKQAKQTKEELKNIDIDLIICSPLKRAKKTAEIINEGRNIPIIFDDQIIERNFGEFYTGTAPGPKCMAVEACRICESTYIESAGGCTDAGNEDGIYAHGRPWR